MKKVPKDQYSKSSNLWIASRNSDNLSSVDEKMLKQNRPHFFIEKPAMDSKLGNLAGKKVLCLGCGSGEEVEMIKMHGATKIVGIDISEELIQHAKGKFPDCEFHIMSADNLNFENSSFDFVFSSLVMHYFKDWTKVLGEVYRVLKKGGTFLFSTLHPVKWSAKKLNDEDGKAYATLVSFQRDPKTGKQEIFGDCHNVVELTETWMKSLTVTMYPRSITNMFRPLIAAGFKVIDLYEPKAIGATKKYDIDYYEVNQRIPNFIIFECVKD